MEAIDSLAARRLALARAGLLEPRWSGLPRRAAGRGRRARAAAHAVVGRFGYLQLDSVSVAGARSHAIVLLSRLEGFDPALAESLLAPGEPLFEYWGHEASWMPIELYPAFAFRRRALRRHPWIRDVLDAHPRIASDLCRRIRDEGPIRSLEMEGRGSRGWWDLKLARRVAAALWSSGELAIRERRGFQRAFDLTERVIPAVWLQRELSEPDALEELLRLALSGHGFATTGTLARTWRLRNRRVELASALGRMQERGEVVACALHGDDGKRRVGWVRPCDLELAERLRRARPRCARGVLLSPFDPLLWERERVQQLFGFEQRLEIFKPAATRRYGYYCLPVLAGDRLIARFDLKAERKAGRLRVRALHFEASSSRGVPAEDREAARSALARFARALELRPVGAPR